MINGELIVDNFAGGGGTSTGIYAKATNHFSRSKTERIKRQRK